MRKKSSATKTQKQHTVEFVACIEEYTINNSLNTGRAYVRCRLNTGHWVSLGSPNLNFKSQMRLYFGKKYDPHAEPVDKVMEKCITLKLMFTFKYRLMTGKKYSDQMFPEVHFT